MNQLSLLAALGTQRLGFTPIPLRPGRKAPLLREWQHTSLGSPEEVSALWEQAEGRAGSHPLNIGVVLGASNGGLVDVDLDHPKALLVAGDLLPKTTTISGRPSKPISHYWYAVEGYDPGIVQCALPDGTMIVEYRATGGQTAIPPSRHPDGEDYMWAGEIWGGPAGPPHLTAMEGMDLHARVLLIALTVTLSESWPSTGSRHAAYLPLVGALLRDADEKGEPRLHPLWNEIISDVVRIMTKLTYDKDGPATRIGETVHSTRRRILSGKPVQGWPSLAAQIGEETVAHARHWVEALETLTETPRGRLRRPASGEGDAEGWATGPALVAVPDSTGEGEEVSAQQQAVDYAALPLHERDPLKERTSEWAPVDLGPFLAGLKPPKPGVLIRDDGQGLFYPGRVNILYGSGGSGKTLIALDVARQTMDRGERVMLIDFEDEPANTVQRLLDLGTSRRAIEEQFAYLRPMGQPLSALHVDRWGEKKPNSGESSRVLADALRRYSPSLIIVDGTTSLFRIHGLDTNGAEGTDLVAGWLRQLTEGKKSNERTVILIDHTSKNAAADSGPIGSQHKIAMVQGTALHVKADKSSRPRRGKIGSAALLVGKDRLGVVMGASSEGDPPVAANVTFDNETDPALLTITYATPDPRDSAHVQFTDAQQQVLDALVKRATDNPGDPALWFMSTKEVLTATGRRDLDSNTMTGIFKMLAASSKIEHNGGQRSASKWRAVLT